MLSRLREHGSGCLESKSFTLNIFSGQHSLVALHGLGEPLPVAASASLLRTSASHPKAWYGQAMVAAIVNGVGGQLDNVGV